MNPMLPHAPRDRAQEGGAALAVLLHMVLLLAVIGQLVYLASRYRVRVDLTTDKLWSSTASTRGLIEKLDEGLVIQAFFSPKEKLPVTYRTTRAWADNFLDELVQLGKGKVVLQRLDPNADKDTADMAKRVGIKPLELKSSSSTSLSVDVHWQGLRLRYGGQKQKVVPQFTPGSSLVAEALLTPAIKEVITEQKRKFGYMEWPAMTQGPQGAQGIGWNLVRSTEGVAKRYEFQNLKDEDGALLPPDIDTLLLFRPKDLTDRQKYVIDQFVMRGGTLVVFADAAEYAIGPQRTFMKVPMQIDAAGSQLPFVSQLATYGLDWRPKLVADMLANTQQPRDPFRAPFEYLCLQQQNAFGQMQNVPAPYGWFFHAMAQPWATHADLFARNDKGEVDQAVAAEYRKRFVPGMPSDAFLFSAFKQLGRGPGFYWPTWAGLREKADGVPDLPAGVRGSVMLWSSPAALVEDPPQMVNPLGFGTASQRKDAYDKFSKQMAERYQSAPRLQAPLMAEVQGEFVSCFAGKERPKRPSQIKEEEAKKVAAATPKDEPLNPDVGPLSPDAQQQVEPAKGGAKDAAKAVVAEADMLAKSGKPGRIVLIGDADFLRDDFVRGDYMQGGGPYSLFAGPFWSQLLDWIAEDQDLVALQTRGVTDRTLRFADELDGPKQDPRLAEQRLRSKTTLLRLANVLVPSVLLALFGLSVLLVRRGQKRSFLAAQN